MRVLALDTSTFVGAVAVTVDDELVCELAVRVRASFGEALLPWVDRALEAARLTPTDLDLVVYSRGPGSFTGVRIGLALAKGLAVTTGVPIVGVSSLTTLAHQVWVDSGVVCPVIDARKHEVYFAVLRATGQGSFEEVVPEAVAPPAVAASRIVEATGGAEALVIGEGARAYPEELLGGIGSQARLAPRELEAPRGAVVARLGVGAFLAGTRDDPALASPVYLRPPDAEYKPRA